MKFSQFKTVLHRYDYFRINRFLLKRTHDPECLLNLLKWYNKNKPGIWKSSKRELTTNQFYELILLEIEIRKWEKKYKRNIDIKTKNCISDIYEETGFFEEALDTLISFEKKLTPELVQHLSIHQDHISFYKSLVSADITLPLDHALFKLLPDDNEKMSCILFTLGRLKQLKISSIDFVLKKVSLEKIANAFKCGSIDIYRWQLILNSPNPNQICDFMIVLKPFANVNTLQNLILLSNLKNPNDVITALHDLSPIALNQLMFEGILDSSVPVQLAHAFLITKNPTSQEQQALIFSKEPMKIANAIVYAKSKCLDERKIDLITKSEKPLETAYAFVKLGEAKINISDYQSEISRHSSPQLLATAIVQLAWMNKLEQHLNTILTQDNPIHFVKSLNLSSASPSTSDAAFFKNDAVTPAKHVAAQTPLEAPAIIKI